MRKGVLIKMLACLMFFFFILAYSVKAQKIVYKKKKNRYYTEYGVSGSWCFECSKNIGDMAGKGTKRCTLQPTNGKQWTSGIYKSKDGPKIVLYAKPKSDIEVSVENAYINANKGDKVSIVVGGQVFMKHGGPFGSEDTWKNDEAQKIIDLFKKENTAKMIFVSNTDKKYSKNYSLIGFTKAFNYIESFAKEN